MDIEELRAEKLYEAKKRNVRRDDTSEENVRRLRISLVFYKVANVFKKIKIRLIKIYFNVFYIEYETEIINNELYVYENHILYEKLIYTSKKGG